MKSAIVTGASRGIGAATAKELACEGFAVVVNYKTNEAKARQVVEEIRAAGAEAQAFCADVGDPGGAKALVEFAAKSYGAPEVLVNNAGVSLFALAHETTDEQWETVFNVNVRAIFDMCRQVIPYMLARRSGHIVNIGSMWGRTGAACESAYSASKGAVEAYTKSLAKELGPSGIAVNCIAPGFIDTDMNAGLERAAREQLISETPLARVGEARDVAQAVACLIRTRYVTGQIIGVDGGLVI